MNQGDNVLKLIMRIIKRVIISSFLLYGYNLIVQPIGLIIPINMITIIFISILGVPALLSLIFIMLFVY